VDAVVYEIVFFCVAEGFQVGHDLAFYAHREHPLCLFAEVLLGLTVEFKSWLNENRKISCPVRGVLLGSVVKTLRAFSLMSFLKVPVMSELRRLKEKLKSCYLNGFFLDRNTFLKADDAEFTVTPRKGDDGRMIEKPMVVLKNVAEMTIDHQGKIVAVRCMEKLGVWADAFEHAMKWFNQ